MIVSDLISGVEIGLALVGAKYRRRRFIQLGLVVRLFLRHKSTTAGVIISVHAYIITWDTLYHCRYGGQLNNEAKTEVKNKTKQKGCPLRNMYKTGVDLKAYPAVG